MSNLSPKQEQNLRYRNHALIALVAFAIASYCFVPSDASPVGVALWRAVASLFTGIGAVVSAIIAATYHFDA